MRLRYRPLILHRSADFGALQVQAHALAVDQHKTLVDQLLADRASLGMEAAKSSINATVIARGK